MSLKSPEDDMPSSSLFASVPEVCCELVSSLAAPPDVYNLCLSSKHFHTRPDTDTSESSPVNKRPRRAAAAKAKAKMDYTTPVLATRLLRESLLSSLGRVLKCSESGITLGMFYTYYEQHVLVDVTLYESSPLTSVPFVPSDALTKLPEGSALIAGSTMVQGQVVFSMHAIFLILGYCSHSIFSQLVLARL